MGMAQYKEQLLNEFEGRSDNWSYSTFEKRLGEVRKGKTYQDAKGIINEAHSLGRWPKTVKQYLLTNYQVFGNVSSEFSSTFSDVIAGMSESEKKSYGLS
tara:strand:- start:105 stop:404 length:300 start_codon:yes stop_codon:yes gene_type:complete